MASRLLPLITTSEQRSFKACQRKHHFRYVALREPMRESASAAYFGTLAHVGMEHIYRGKAEGGDELDRGLSYMYAAWAAADEPDEYIWQKASVLISGYYLRWADARLAVVAVEAEFRAPLINPDTGAKSRTYDLGGKIDVIVRDLETGDLLLMEHKSSSLDITAGSEYWTKLRMDDQISAYFDGARSLGYEVQGCLYDVLKRPGQKPQMATPEEDRQYTQPKDARPGKPCKEHKDKALAFAKVHREKLLVRDIPNFPGCGECSLPKDAEPSRLYAGQRDSDETPAEYGLRIGLAIAEAPDTYYQRGLVVRLTQELQDARWDTWTTAKQMREAQLNGRHVRNPNACTNYNSTCGYFSVCSGEASIDDPYLFTDRAGKHSELDGHPSEREGTKDHDSNSSSNEQPALF